MTGQAPSLWRISLAADSDTVAAYEDALDPFCHAISWIATEIENQWQIEGFCDDEPDRDRLDQAMAAVAQAFTQQSPQLHIEPVAARDWLIENLQSFPPIHAGHYFIYGTHFEGQVPPGRTGICLNPGRAFGSGDHATTRGCLLAMDHLAKSFQFARMLDMGCGSGILSIAMAHTW
ncbi:MAG TPA: 50S ribosomal protein L11 methyltransferase, partial [Rhodospirillales bacterium]|nr:50S ribosomal protein L11 methyltransferase [Rhodospirillales bacterium]